jgi:threonine dehydratase
VTAPPLTPVSLSDVVDARRRIAGTVVRTPLVRLHVDAPAEIWLKLETLQPIGSFKLRGATNAIQRLREEAPERLTRGVYTASAGNMAQGVAWGARVLGIPCTVVVPETAPRTKIDAVERLGARVVKRSFDDWWRVMVEHGDPSMEGTFVHPFADADVMAGNGTIALEILEDLPDVDTIVVPYGGGGLVCGIASAIRAQAAEGDSPAEAKPPVRVLACEVDTAAPLTAALAAGAPAATSYAASFVDGIGSKRVSDEMWPLARTLLDGTIVVSLREIADAVRLLAERVRVIAEGAGGASLAAALSGKAGDGRVVCVISGGNIDAARLGAILDGRVPEQR